MLDSIFHSVKLATAIGLFTLVLSVAGVYWKKVLRPYWLTRHIPRLRRSTKETPGKYISAQDILIRDLHAGLVENSGTILRHTGWLLPPLLITTDRAALHEIIFTQHMRFPKPPPNPQAHMRAALDPGLLFSEGEQWHRQRKVMSSSFGTHQMKAMYSIFLDKAMQLRDVVSRIIADSETGRPTVDIYDFTERVALDTISSAGFGYETDSIRGDMDNPLLQALKGSFEAVEPFSIMGLLRNFTPIGRLIPNNSPSAVLVRNALKVMHDIGQDLVKQKTEAAFSTTNGDRKLIEASQVTGRDILSILVRSNLSEDIKHEQRMSDEEVQAQIATFFVAGRSTTSSAISWAIYSLCSRSEFQCLLRDEVCASPTDTPTYDELNALPFLDAVVRETMRFHTPVPGTARMALEDTVLPLSEPYVDVNGVRRDSIFVPKGTVIYIPLRLLNLSPKTWGPDVEEFNPLRWLSDTSRLPDGALEIPSLTMPSFLCGPRACIGFRFTLIEMKAVLFSLFRTAKFELAVPVDDIECESRALTRPRLKSRPQDGFQLPVKLTALDGSL